MTRFGFVSTFPPTRCGVASYTAALVGAISMHPRDDSVIVRVDDGVPAGPSLPGVRQRIAGVLRPDDLERRLRAAAELNDCDVVIVQYAHGVYGGADGDEVVELIDLIESPVVAVMHTVPAQPTPHVAHVMKAIVDRVDVVVAMTASGARLLRGRYGVDARRLRLIPHGVADWALTRVVTPRTADHRPTVLTWGLLGPGTGIESGIRAIAELQRSGSAPAYRVLGATRPKLVVDSGQRYRRSLLALAEELGVEGLVEIDGRYREAAELAAEVAAADLVLLPYDPPDQATSAVLVEALAAGLPVVATRFPHATELLSRGRGLLVDAGDPVQIAAALDSVIHSPAPRARRAARTGSLVSWDAVAEEYRALAVELMPPISAAG